MKIRMPSKKVCEVFHLCYELRGAQRGADVLTRYYGVRNMRIIVDGRRVGRGCDGQYWKGKAHFTRKGLTKANVLHELYHHIVENKEIEMGDIKEEMEANRFVKAVTKKM